MYDLVIIGGGPAALSAAMYAFGKQLRTRIVALELGGKAGARQRLVGQLDDEYLSGDDAVRAFARRVMQSDTLLAGHAREVRRDGDTFRVVTDDHGELPSIAVLVATGAVPNELPVRGANEFLGQGLGYSVATHAHLVAGKTAAVIGNTLRALRGAAELADAAEQVYLIVYDATILVDPLAQALERRANVELLVDTRVTELDGGQNLEQVVVEQAGQPRSLPVDAAFVDLGLHANSGVVRRLLELDPGQFIPVDERNATAVPGLFAAGDVTSAFGEQTLIAIGEGAKAALGAYDYVLARRAGLRQQS